MRLAIIAFFDRPPWWDVAWATWALVIVGLVGTIAAIWTLVTIKRQTDAIERQVYEIRNTSLQTDRLIEEATKQSIATKKSAEALIDSERARIMVELEWVPGYPNITHTTGSMKDRPTRSYTSAAIRFVYTNEGKTIGWIDEKLACFQIVRNLPDFPDYNALEMLDPTPEWIAVKGKGHLDQTLHADGQEGEGFMSVVWGVIRYRDTFYETHEAVFGFRITPDYRFERLAGLFGYNT